MTGDETRYIEEAVASGRISGNGAFTRKCQQFFERRYGFRKTLLTSSCTDALEMCALLLDLKDGDEILVPSFTFVSSANAFVMHGAKVVFVDCEDSTPNIDPTKLEPLISERTRAIVVVHYAGISCDFDPIFELAQRHNLVIIEDAAHAIDASYRGRPLGGLGNLATLSFHETKNITSGEGGLLIINDERFLSRAEVLWEKGTNRAAQARGEVRKYEWIDLGSSFLPSDVTAAFLYAQLEKLDLIQSRRRGIWNQYHSGLSHLASSGKVAVPFVPDYAELNGHLYYLVCKSLAERDSLMNHLTERGIMTTFHYLPLHLSPFYASKHDGRHLPNAIRYSDCLLRLPFFYEMSKEQVEWVVDSVCEFYR